MKKRLMVIVMAIVMALGCVAGLMACGGGVDGTYYAYENGVKLEDGSMVLSDGNITMKSNAMGSEISMSGTYTVDGDTINITVTVMGVSVTQKLTKVSDGVLKSEENGVVTYFCKDGKTPPSDSAEDAE